MSDDNEFYVGYLPHVPQGLARFVKRVVACLVICAAVIAVALVFLQQPFPNSTFEFGTIRTYHGAISDRPYPMLTAPTGQFLLVLPGKHGAGEFARTHNGSLVDVQGSRIERGGQQMIEIAPASVRTISQSQPAPETRSLGEMSLGEIVLTGEIVDSKCYLGVMNPGNKKVHRDCAVRCISGGIPPAFIAVDSHGRTEFMLLAGAHGEPVRREVLDYVGEPVTIRGLLTRTGETLVLLADPSLVRRAE